MGKRQKTIDRENAVRLRRVRDLLAEASELLYACEGLGRDPDTVILRHCVETAEVKAEGVHARAHFGATGSVPGVEPEPALS